MKKPSDKNQKLLIDLLGFSENNSIQKSYYPQLQSKLKELKKEKEKYFSLFDNTSDAIFICDANLCIKEVNLEVINRFGFSGEELTGKSFLDLIHKKDHSKINQIRDNRQTSKVTNLEVEHIRLANSPIYSNINAQKIDLYEKPSVILVCRDITKSKLEQQRLKKLHKFYQKVIENSKSILYRYHFDSDCYEFISSGFAHLFGMEPHEITTRDSIKERIVEVRDFKTCEIIDLHEWDKKIASGQVDSFKAEWKIKTPSGEIRYLFDSSLPLYKKPGNKVIGSQGILMDITDRKTSEIKLEQTQKFINTIINSLPSVIISIDAELNITHRNSESSKLLTGKEILPDQVKLFTLFPFLKQLSKEITNCITTHIPVVQKRLKLKIDRQDHLYEIAISPLLTDNLKGAVIRMDDITNKIKLEQMMLQSEKMLSIGGLAAGMAHEINNPIAGIIQNTQVLQLRLNANSPKGQQLSETIGIDRWKIENYLSQLEVFKILSMISESGKRAAKIVRNMLSFARKDESEKGDHNIIEMIEETLHIIATDYNMKKKYDFKKIKIIRDYIIKNKTIYCNRGQIQQVLLNLFKNGAEAMQQTAELRHPEFKIGLMEDPEFLNITINDNGPGIPGSIIKNIFDPFFTTKEPGMGTGLGLSVSYYIITKNHKGTMSIEKSNNSGTRFKIQLPVKPK